MQTPKITIINEVSRGMLQGTSVVGLSDTEWDTITIDWDNEWTDEDIQEIVDAVKSLPDHSGKDDTLRRLEQRLSTAEPG